ncbi:MAG: hypothetical protein V2I36_13925 [Desulfopila sp.]|jgi:hypothetical protein|nr:hypothetical protein [Desulfopila sp.]
MPKSQLVTNRFEVLFVSKGEVVYENEFSSISKTIILGATNFLMLYCNNYHSAFHTRYSRRCN